MSIVATLVSILTIASYLITPSTFTLNVAMVENRQANVTVMGQFTSLVLNDAAAGYFEYEDDHDPVIKILMAVTDEQIKDMREIKQNSGFTGKKKVEPLVRKYMGKYPGMVYTHHFSKYEIRNMIQTYRETKNMDHLKWTRQFSFVMPEVTEDQRVEMMAVFYYNGQNKSYVTSNRVAEHVQPITTPIPRTGDAVKPVQLAAAAGTSLMAIVWLKKKRRTNIKDAA